MPISGSIDAIGDGTSPAGHQFLDSSIRSELESALAESAGGSGACTCRLQRTSGLRPYAVVDQVYVNNKCSTPQSDVLRILVNRPGSAELKISDVTVLEVTPAARKPLRVRGIVRTRQ